MNKQDTSLRNRSLELCRRVVTTESFIAEAKGIYGNRYDYSKVNYKNRDHRVIVTCPVHGDFQVYAREHLDGKGCPKCEKGEKFIAKLKDKFGDKFGLDEFVYESSTLPVTLICPTHGAFSRLPNQILNARCGCPECGQESWHQEILDQKEKRLQEKLERERKEKEEVENAWEKKIQIIQSGEDFDGEIWYKDFFGYDFTNLLMASGQPMHGKFYFTILDNSHYPLDYVEIQAEAGSLTKGYFSFKCKDPEDDLIDEVLLVCENAFSEGEIFLLEEVKKKYKITKVGQHLFSILTNEYNIDGYNVRIQRYWDSVSIKIRRLGAKRRITYRTNFSQKSLPKSFVGIDFETLFPQRVSACSVGMVKYINGEIVDRFYSLFRPPFDYPGKCGRVLTWIHGLTEDMVKDASTFEEILPLMESFTDGLPLVAHNACVERSCIRDACAFYGIETKLDYENIFDTLVLSRQAEAKLGISEEGPGTHQLDTVCKRFGIEGNNHHNALADAEMSGNLMVLFQKILCEGETVEVAETPTLPKQKYNPEDKVQRSDIENVVDNPFKNQVVVLTGFAKSDSQEYAHKLNELGAIIKDGVNKKTNILITGYNAGPSKMQKAKEVGARIMSEEEFKEIINQL